MAEKLRIYIGGLGSTVREDDLKKTFTSPQLGIVESVEIIRSKGRSFGYLEYVPASDKGLAKLFSMYNGCMWKGGRLKLEKARQHYLLRLKQEWEEEAELKNQVSIKNVDAGASVDRMEKLKKILDTDKLQLKIFFPKLRKIRPVPFKGTGKHKYSFQRIEVPPMPIHFCDCEEHCGSPEFVKRKCSDDVQEMEICGVNDDELNMMTSVLNKFLNEENYSKKVPKGTDSAHQTNGFTSVETMQADNNEEDETSDEDNLVINVVGKRNAEAALFEDWGQKIAAADKKSLAKKSGSVREPISEKEDQYLIPDKKRKLSIRENNNVLSKRKVRKVVQHDSMDGQLPSNNQQTEIESGSTQLSFGVANSHKSSWRDLIREKGNAAFCISDVLAESSPDIETEAKSDDIDVPPCLSGKGRNDVKLKKGEELERDHSPEVEAKAKTEGIAAPLCSIEKDSEHGPQLNKAEELEKCLDVQPPESSATDTKYARGAGWQQESSWLQLLADATNNNFSLGQILPGVTSEKPALQDRAGLSNARTGNDLEDQSLPTEDNSELGRARNKDIHATSGNNPTKKQNDVDGHETQPYPHSNQAVEEKDELLAVDNVTNLVTHSRAARNIVISETCPFMRDAASVKEWTKTKAALSGAHKKKGKAKTQSQD